MITTPKLTVYQKEVAALAAQIMTGLLASGHYTTSPSSSKPPRLVYRDFSQGWAELGMPERFIPEAVLDAVDMAKTLKVVASMEEDTGEKPWSKKPKS